MMYKVYIKLSFSGTSTLYGHAPSVQEVHLVHWYHCLPLHLDHPRVLGHLAVPTNNNKLMYIDKITHTTAKTANNLLTNKLLN